MNELKEHTKTLLRQKNIKSTSSKLVKVIRIENKYKCECSENCSCKFDLKTTNATNN